MLASLGSANSDATFQRAEATLQFVAGAGLQQGAWSGGTGDRGWAIVRFTNYSVGHIKRQLFVAVAVAVTAI